MCDSGGGGGSSERGEEESSLGVAYGEEHVREVCACAYWVRAGVSFRIFPCMLHNQHVSRVRVCVCASVSQALVSLCLRVISPELAALKHQ